MRKLLLILGLFSLLGGCGGGGTDPIEIPNTSINHLIGKWFATDLYCYQAADNSPPNAQLNFYYRNGPIVNTVNSYTETYATYTDPTCTNQTGQYADTYEVVWTKSIAPQPKINARRIRVLNPIRIATDNPPAWPLPSTTTFKLLFDGDGQRVSIYYGNNGDTLDAEGYPQGTNNLPNATYRK